MGSFLLLLVILSAGGVFGSIIATIATFKGVINSTKLMTSGQAGQLGEGKMGSGYTKPSPINPLGMAGGSLQTAATAARLMTGVAGLGIGAAMVPGELLGRVASTGLKAAGKAAIETEPGQALVGKVGEIGDNVQRKVAGAKTMIQGTKLYKGGAMAVDTAKNVKNAAIDVATKAGGMAGAAANFASTEINNTHGARLAKRSIRSLNKIQGQRYKSAPKDENTSDNALPQQNNEMQQNSGTEQVNESPKVEISAEERDRRIENVMNILADGSDNMANWAANEAHYRDLAANFINENSDLSEFEVAESTKNAIKMERGRAKRDAYNRTNEMFNVQDENMKAVDEALHSSVQASVFYNNAVSTAMTEKGYDKLSEDDLNTARERAEKMVSERNGLSDKAKERVLERATEKEKENIINERRESVEKQVKQEMIDNPEIAKTMLGDNNKAFEKMQGTISANKAKWEGMYNQQVLAGKVGGVTSRKISNFEEEKKKIEARQEQTNEVTPSNNVEAASNNKPRNGRKRARAIHAAEIRQAQSEARKEKWQGKDQESKTESDNKIVNFEDRNQKSYGNEAGKQDA